MGCWAEMSTPPQELMPYLFTWWPEKGDLFSERLTTEWNVGVRGVRGEGELDWLRGVHQAAQGVKPNLWQRLIEDGQIKAVSDVAGLARVLPFASNTRRCVGVECFLEQSSCLRDCRC